MGSNPIVCTKQQCDVNGVSYCQGVESDVHCDKYRDIASNYTVCHTGGVLDRICTVLNWRSIVSDLHCVKLLGLSDVLSVKLPGYCIRCSLGVKLPRYCTRCLLGVKRPGYCVGHFVSR